MGHELLRSQISANNEIDKNSFESVVLRLYLQANTAESLLTFMNKFPPN